MASVASTNPTVSRYVLIIDDLEGACDVPYATTINPLDVFNYEHLLELAFSYDVTEFSTAVKPFLLHYLFELGYDGAMYIDPDILVFSSLAPVLEPLATANVVLTPHVTEPIPLDDRLPSENTLLRAGGFNLGFIGVRNTPACVAMLDWWAARLNYFCVNDVQQGYFTDQKWMDLVPGLLPKVAVVRHRGCNVAYWNYHTRRLSRTTPRHLASGEPIVFFHFSGFNVLRPEAFSKHQTRIDVHLDAPLQQLLVYYRDEVLRNGWEDAHRIPYAYATFSNGAPQDGATRRLIREARIGGHRFPDARDVDASPSAWNYVNSPHPGDSLTRYQAAIAEREDLRRAFPDVHGSDRASFLSWFATDKAQGTHYRFKRHASKPLATRGVPGAGGVNVVGYFRAESGVAEAGRAHVRALEAAGIATRLYDISEQTVHRKTDVSLSGQVGGTPYGINLVCANADSMREVEAEIGSTLLGGRYNVGSWWWELPEFPEQWAGAFRPFNEIWTGTRFIRESVARSAPIDVYVIPPVVDVTDVALVGREFFGLPRGATMFLFMFDFLSVFARKNPLGLLEAFQAAFRSNEDVILVLKFINGNYDPVNEGILRYAAQSDKRVMILDRYFSRGEKNALLRCCDAYVSLHRSEGFGYTMAEAMLLGRPVIATGWSGNMDFMNATNSLPVNFQLVDLDRDYGPYRAGQHWAEPDLQDAARKMRSIHEDREGALRLAEAGRADVRAGFSQAAVAAIVQRRLAGIEAVTGGDLIL